MIDLLKSIYYRVNKPALRRGYNLSLGFIFHTECIYSAETFNSLLVFCERFERITKKRPLCVVMSPLNFRVHAEANQTKFTLEDFQKRLQELAAVADIGFHGHFWRKDSDFEENRNHVRQFNYTQHDNQLIEKQFKDDYAWLKDFDFVKPYYAAGWWFVNSAVLKTLLREKIQADFSFSFLKWVSNEWSKEFMKERGINFGEPFKIENEKGETIQCIQTLMGCPNTKHPQDFIRIMNGYLDDNRQPVGMIATHDYNLLQGNNLTYSTQLIEYLASQKNITFLSAPELLKEKTSNNKRFLLQ